MSWVLKKMCKTEKQLKFEWCRANLNQCIGYNKFINDQQIFLMRIVKYILFTQLFYVARNDLNPANGTYPFHALSHRSSGATDAKVTSYKLAQQLGFLAVSGPTTGAHLPPFQWSKSDFNLKLSHRGQPDIFFFQPVYITWPDLR